MAAVDASCVGIDVGGRRKGFHAAAVSGTRVIAGPQRFADVDTVLAWLREIAPQVIALDSPMTCAVSGESSRPGERALMKEICGIRWTPEESKLVGNPYYEWVICGRELYSALNSEHQAWSVIEVFPTASWTVWAGPRRKVRRAKWSRLALEEMTLDGLPERRLNQDDRDAVAAALTASLYLQGETKAFGEIVVPASGDAKSQAAVLTPHR